MDSNLTFSILKRIRLGPVILTFALSNSLCHGQIDKIEGINGAMPQVGDTGIRFITPSLVEVARINTFPGGGAITTWNFIDSSGVFVPPGTSTYTADINGTATAASISGFRRRTLYAPLSHRDLRIDNRIFFTLTTPANEGDRITITTTGWEGGGATSTYMATLDGNRRSPAVHANQEGYEPIGPKQGMVGYYLGNAGELTIPSPTFSLIDDTTGQAVFNGTLTLKQDVGYTYSPMPYQNVLVADFSSYEMPGKYRLKVPALGTSLPFRIASGELMNALRTYAIGIYNQRCGHSNELPFSRHTHAACHVAQASIPMPESSFGNTWDMISSSSYGAITSQSSLLFPYTKTGTLDVSGGHHDAGDYSRYTTNSAQFLHYLAFAADAFPGVGALDNLGIPESGDGKSDILQEAKIEADYLAKMQDDDGGFYFLVYPKNRPYEDDVLPDGGDEQVVWPKSTTSTADCVAALADIASSPLFKQQFPEDAARYLQKAQAGWNFLLNAIATHGKDGSYQQPRGESIFGHNDELAWAAAAMFAATGDPVCQQKLMEWWPDPTASSSARWGWWYLYDAYGSAARSYAFAVKTGKRTDAEMNQDYLAKAKAVLISTGQARRLWTDHSSYSSCLDDNSKRQTTAGWFISSERAFDMTVANALQPESSYKSAVIGNLNYDFGCNPLNVTYVTGVGVRRQREIVNQYAQNDRRVFPPSGIPLGDIQNGFSWTNIYGTDISKVTFPSDGLDSGKYPQYDRWGDAFNVTTEAVIPDQGRILASIAAWAASGSPAATQPWKPEAGKASIILPPGYVTAGQPVTVSIQYQGLDLADARVTWESGDQDPWIGGPEYTFTPTKVCSQWLEAEVVLPDGRRFSAVTTLPVKSATGGQALTVQDNTVALYHFDDNYNDSSPNGYHLTASGNTELVDNASGWMANPGGKAVRFHDVGDTLTANIPDACIAPPNMTAPLVFEAWICTLNYKTYGKTTAPGPICLAQSYNSSLGCSQDKWILPNCPSVGSDNVCLVSNSKWNDSVKPGTWQHLKIIRKTDFSCECRLDGVLIGSAAGVAPPDADWDWTLTLGNFDGYIDEVCITGRENHGKGAATTTTGGTGTGSTGSSTGSTGNTSTATVIAPVNQNYEPDQDTIALYTFDGNYNDTSGNGFHLTPVNGPSLVPARSASGASRGNVLHLQNFGDAVTVTIPDSLIAPGETSSAITIDAWIYPYWYTAWGQGYADIIALTQWWDSSLRISQDKWLNPGCPYFMSGGSTLISNVAWSDAVKPGKWQHIQMTRDTLGNVSFWVDEKCVTSAQVENNYKRTDDWTFRLGDICADIDEVRISNIIR
jgi:hypothetical protein